MRRILIEKSERFHRVVSHPMDELLPSRRRAEKRLGSVVDLSSLEPDLALPESSRGSGVDTGVDPCEVIADRIESERGIRLDPRREILPCEDVASALEDLALAFIDPSDVVLIPDPALPIYRQVSVLAGGWPISIPIAGAADCVPAWERIEPEATRRAKMLWFSSPNLPTGRIARKASLQRLIEIARRDNVLVVQDARLAGTRGDGQPFHGLLDDPRGTAVGVEAHELAPWHGGGDRPGFLIGNREVIHAVRTLGRIRRRAGDHGTARLQGALGLGREDHAAAAATYGRRLETALAGLAELGWDAQAPEAGYALWVRVPTRFHSLRFSAMLLRAGIAVVPGIVFGEFGHDSVLLSLTTPEDEIREGLERLRTKFPGRWGLRSWRRGRTAGESR